MKFISIRSTFILALASVLFASVAYAGGKTFRKLQPHVDPGAWYVATWHGYNNAFDPPLEVTITIAADGNVSSFARGMGKSYRVTTRDQVIDLPNLADTRTRGKVLDANTLQMEDDGKLEIHQEKGGLKTVSPDFGIVVHYSKVEGDQH